MVAAKEVGTGLTQVLVVPNKEVGTSLVGIGSAQVLVVAAKEVGT